jgi:phosphonoacetate hydrolase
MDTNSDAAPEPVGPERFQGQGLDTNQDESGNRAIYLLLTEPPASEQTDLVITYRRDAYEVWARRGMIRFQRLYKPNGGYQYRVIEQIGRNPIENQDPSALGTLQGELEAASRDDSLSSDPSQAFIQPGRLSYPFAYERISQLFDSPNAPDIVVNPRSYAFGQQPGQHGALDVIHSRAVLVLSGPGIRPGPTDTACRQVDVAPTIAFLMGFPLLDGRDITGRTSRERGVAADVYLRRQDGRVHSEVLDLNGEGRPRARPASVYILIVDGMASAEFLHCLDKDTVALPNLRRLVERGAFFRLGAIATFPTITWPSHNAIGCGAWCGHHDAVGPSYYLRQGRQVVRPQEDRIGTVSLLSKEVETLFEAFHRVYGGWPQRGGVFTASINSPSFRGADHTALDGRLVGDSRQLTDLIAAGRADTNPRWLADGQEHVQEWSVTDNLGLAQARQLLTDRSHPVPGLVLQALYLTDAAGHDYGPHSDGLRAALEETDVRIGRVLGALDERGLFDSTLFVLMSDHGMAATDLSLAGNPTLQLRQAGMKVVVTDLFAYLLDVDVQVELEADGRTITVIVRENDVDERGVRPPVQGARVALGESSGSALAEAETNDLGVATLSLPTNVQRERLLLSIDSERFNPRHLRLDGTSVVEDLRQALYGDAHTPESGSRHSKG